MPTFRKIALVLSIALTLAVAIVGWCVANPTVTITPTTGAYTATPTQPMTETTGQLLISATTGGMGVARSVTGSLATTSGSIASGSRSVMVLISSDYTGTIQTLSFTGAADNFVRFSAPSGDTLGAIAYTVTTGSLRLFVVQ